MANIKFRVWSKKYNEWSTEDCYENPFNFSKDKNYIYHHITFDDIEGHIIELSTGILDKNGKEIYEGDILDIDIANTDELPEWRAIVKFEDGAFYLENQNYDDGDVNDSEGTCFHYYAISSNKKEILGNIHENPELINE